MAGKISERSRSLSPAVFVSYVHGTSEHKQQVLDFARFLQTQGIQTILDRWTTSDRKDWYTWIVAEMTRVDFVLAIASRPYSLVFDGSARPREHRGTQAEAAVLRELLYSDRSAWLPKILPVLLPGRSVDEVPLILQPNTADHYRIADLTTEGAEELLRVLTRQPKHLRPSPGGIPVLPPQSS